MPLNEDETRTKLIDPAIKAVGWTEDHIRSEETAGKIAIIRGKAVRARTGRTDYTLRIKISKDAQPVAVAVVEAKAEDKHPAYGINPLFPALRTCHRLFQRPSPQKQFPSSQ